MRFARRGLMVLCMFVLGGASLWGGLAQASGSVSLVGGMIYTQANTADGAMPLRLDLYTPRLGCDPDCPVILALHGGGFRVGTRKSPGVVMLAEAAAQAGFAVVAIDYRHIDDNPRLSERVKDGLADEIGVVRSKILQRSARGDQAVAALAAAEDTAAAMGWIMAQADRYGLNADKVALFGSSAGAVTALALAYGADELRFDLPMAIAGVVGFQGRLPDLLDIAPGDAPLMIVHGTEDARIPFDDAARLRARAKSAQLPVWFVPVGGKGHGITEINLIGTQVGGATLLSKMLMFFDQTLQDPASLMSQCVSNRADLCG